MEFNAPQTAEAYHQNFAQIKGLMNATEAHYESSRCLFCYDAPCVQACPTGIDIPLFIRQIHAGNALGAAKTIYESNYLGNACGKVCPTEVLCEGACVYNQQEVKPLEIGRLQNFATQKAIAAERHWHQMLPSNGKKVAIIGAGPAGLACACELRKNGVEVHIFEAKAKASGLTVHGVAPYKITNEEVMEEISYLQNGFGFHLHLHHPIHSDAQIEALEKEYDAIFLGIGLGKTAFLTLSGESLEGCFGAVEFVEELRHRQHQIQVPKQVVVLGGGNTAMDAASECMRMGAEEVFLVYRRGKAEMGAYDFEYELAKSVGVKGIFNAAPKRILGDEEVEGVLLVKTQTEDGKVVEIPNSEFSIPCDWVIKATGQSKHESFLSKIADLATHQGKIVVNEAFQCTNPKYYAGGDAVSGGKEVVNAAFEGKQAALAMLNSFAS